MKFKNETVTDERIKSLLNKYWAQAGVLALAIAYVSIVVKCLILNLPFESYFVEVCILVLPSIYFFVRAIRSGILSSHNNNKGKQLLACIIGGVLYSVIMTAYAYFSDIDESNNELIRIIVRALIHFVVFTAVMFFLHRWISKLSNNRIKKMIGDDSDEYKK